MGVAVGHLKEVHDFALVPDVVAGSEDVNPQLEQFFRDLRGDAEPGRRILTVCNDQVDGVVSHQRRQPFFYDIAARPAKNVTNKKYAQ
jgi:hypothetical protein